jgi:UDP-N-acetylmuramoyl-tripeptide--D-alanyl-D-alanine ligase
MLMTHTEPFDAEFLGSAVRGTLVGSPRGTRVVTDSREDVRGALFVALTGPNFDGHDFVEAAVGAGATGAMVSASWWGKGGRDRVEDALVVPDTLLALQDLARAHRARHPIPLVAITGSNGKTTTKELLAAALTPLGTVLKTRGNRNNHVGLPLTLLELSPEHRAAVVEVGLNHPGELRLLSGIARPRVGVITNVAAAHLEGLGSMEGVARAKAEIIAGLEPGGTLVMPLGIAALDAALTGYTGRRLTFGFSLQADLHPEEVDLLGTEGVRLVLPDGVAVRVPLPGEHTVLNALAALAAAKGLGVPPAQAAPHLAEVKPVHGRLEPRTVGGVTIIDDSYNANPASLEASLAVLRRSAGTGKRWAILGDMLELGSEAADLHRRAGAAAAFLDGLVVVGALAHELGRGAVDAGLDVDALHLAETGEEAAHVIAHRLRPGDRVLVKGSRGMRLETAVEALAAALGEKE